MMSNKGGRTTFWIPHSDELLKTLKSKNRPGQFTACACDALLINEMRAFSIATDWWCHEKHPQKSFLLFFPRIIF